jgi:hypothetical protein
VYCALGECEHDLLSVGAVLCRNNLLESFTSSVQLDSLENLAVHEIFMSFSARADTIKIHGIVVHI